MLPGVKQAQYEHEWKIRIKLLGECIHLACTIKSKLYLAFKKLGDYIQTEYMNHLRPNPGISTLPYGAEMYQGFLEYHTSMSGEENSLKNVSESGCGVYVHP